MKQIIVVLLLLTSIVQEGKAQIFSEWFRQNQTQRKYLVEQIALLKIYAGYVQKAYEIGKDGLNFIGDSKSGDFNLHKQYFQSLQRVNPELKKYSRVEVNFDLLIKIENVRTTTLIRLREIACLSEEENQYCEKVYANLMASCNQIAEELKLAATDGQLNLKDDERLNRINTCYLSILDRYAFARSFSNGALALAKSRKEILKSIQRSKIQNGIK